VGGRHSTAEDFANGAIALPASGMYESIHDYLKRVLPFTEDELAALNRVLQPRSFRKGEFFLKEGDICREVIFVRSGLLRIYYVNEGRERIRQFLFENSFITEYESFLSRKPSAYFIDALEPTEVWAIGYEDLNNLYQTSVNFLRLGKAVAENVVVHVGNRYMSLIRDDATTRYLRLIKERPKVMQRVPQYMIASYLGITPEALSRIRKEIAS
jgi:CRP-like cAMP-binding protein